MKKTLLLTLACITLTLASTSWARLPNENRQQSTELAKVIQHAAPAVVIINVVKKPSPAFQSSQQSTNPSPAKEEMSVGSGAIFNAQQGYIVTNAHVVDNAKLIVVRLKNGQRYIGHVKGIDTGFDIAVIQIHAPRLSQMSFSDSDQLKVGNFVVAIGSPFGLDQTVTSGVVSALNVSAPKIEGFQSFIQTDASINPGNSGGPLINMQGKIVGINTAILGPGTNIGIGFAIPSDMVQSVITQLLKYGKVERGMLGVVAQNITPQLASALSIKQTHGTIVSEILPHSPAAQAGIQLQDIIEKVNNKTINTAIQLRNMLGVMRPGTVLKISLRRKHQALTVSATVGNPSHIISERAIPFLSGIKLHDFKELEDNGKILKGAIVVDVQPTSQAALAGIQAGDIITAAENHEVNNTADLVSIANKDPKQLLLKVKRGPMSAFVVIERIFLSHEHLSKTLHH